MNEIHRTNIPQVGEHYRHYKSTGGMDHVYEIVGISKNSEIDIDNPDSIMVVYQPLSLFVDEIKINGEVRPRFTKE